MVKFVALYREPDDVETFRQRYLEEHVPLVEQFPGLQRLEISYTTWPKEDAPCWMMAELWYEDAGTMRASLDSEVSQQALAVLQEFVPEGAVSMFMAEVEEV